MIANLLYGIPILAQNRGLIGETNVRQIELSFCFFYPLKSSLHIFKTAEIATWYPNIGPKLAPNRAE